MKKLKYILVALFIIPSYIFSNVYSFSIDEINQVLEWNHNIDLQWDKIDYNFLKQKKIKKDNIWWYINIWKNNYINSKENLNLNKIKEHEINNNSQQWESKNNHKNSIIPLNFLQKNITDIHNNISLKSTSFKMEYYENWVIKVRNNLQRYLNPDLNSVLIWWVPSTFWFWSKSTISYNPWSDLWENTINPWPILENSDCSKSCNCGQWYNFLWQCKKIPNNSYSTWNWFKCIRWYNTDESWSNCVLIKENEYNKYIWIQSINESNKNTWIIIQSWTSTEYSSDNLWIQNSTYWEIDYDFISEFDSFEYQNTINSSSYIKCDIESKENFYTWWKIPCKIKNKSSIYDIYIK